MSAGSGRAAPPSRCRRRAEERGPGGGSPAEGRAPAGPGPAPAWRGGKAAGAGGVGGGGGSGREKWTLLDKCLKKGRIPCGRHGEVFRVTRSAPSLLV